LAARPLINLIYVLLLSLGMLAPYRPPVLPGIVVLAVAVVGLYDSATTLRQARRAREPRPAITSLAVPVVLPIVWFVLLVAGGVGVLAHQAFGLYLLAAGSAALIATATRSTWTCCCLVARNHSSGRGALSRKTRRAASRRVAAKAGVCAQPTAELAVGAMLEVALVSVGRQDRWPQPFLRRGGC
jgi:hypothetical protein